MTTAAGHPAGLARIVRLLRPHAAGTGGRLAAGAALSVVVIALHVARPWPLKWLVDGVAGGGSMPAPFASLPGELRVVALAALFLALAAAGAAVEYAQVMTLNGVGNRVLFRFRRALFAHLLSLPLGFHEGRDTGELLTRVLSDTSRMRRGVNAILVRVLQTLALFVATLAVVMWIAPRLGAVLAVSGALALLAMQRRGRRIVRAARRQRRKEGVLASLVGGELARVRELQLYGAAGSAVMRHFDHRNDRGLRQEQKVTRLATGLTLRVDVVVAAGIALALGLGALQVAAGRLSAGDLVLFLSYALALRHPFVDFAYQTARLGRIYACADRLARLAERAPGVVDAPTAQPAPPLAGALRLENVSVKAPVRVRSARKWTLRDASVELPAGRRIALVGGNGAGKSTLLRLVARLTPPHAGRVLLDGRELAEYQVASVRSQLSVVFQDPALPGLTVRELIALGRPDATDEMIRAAAERARAHAFIERLPRGYDTVVRRGGDLFSGGERQRLTLACALLRDGRIWLLDEPTTGLDDPTAQAIVDTLLDVTRGRTTLWVTHDPAVVCRLDWVLALDGGRITYAGPVEPYLESPTARTGAALALEH